MTSNIRQAFDLVGEDYPAPSATPARVSFSLEKNGIAVRASVTPDYFDTHVLPVMTRLLKEIDTPAPKAQPEPDAAPPKFRKPATASVRQVVDILSAQSGPELLKAAAVSLAVIQNLPVFTREHLFEEAEKAVGHWRKSHSNSADEILKYLLTSGTLVERGDGQLCLNHSEEKAAILALRAAHMT